MKASFFSVIPVVLGLSFSNVALAEEPPAAAPADAPATEVVAEVAPAEAPAEPVLIEAPAVRPGPVAAELPAAPRETKPAARVKSPAMIIVGSILSGVGASNLIAGGILWAQAEAQDCNIENDSFGIGGAVCDVDQGLNKFVAGALLISGGIHSAVGIPLIAAGSRAPRNNDEAPAPTADLHISATGATFSMTF